MPIRIQRIYEEPAADGGYRVFIDRLWPRGLKKEQARFDVWLKEIAPSTELRRWFGHDPEKWDEFKRRYSRELDEHPDEVAQIAERAAPYIDDPARVRDIVADGCERARAVAQQTMADVRQVMGTAYD